MLRSFLKSHNVPTSGNIDSDAVTESTELEHRMNLLTTQDAATVYRQTSVTSTQSRFDDGNFFKAASMPANLVSPKSGLPYPRGGSPHLNANQEALQTLSPTSFLSDSSSRHVLLDMSGKFSSPDSCLSPEGCMSPTRAWSPTRVRSPEGRRADGGVSKKQRPKRFSNAVASNFCHICCRSSKRVRNAVCKNIELGTCRKVICEKCFTAFGWDWNAATSLSSTWLCTHCTSSCPARSQCGIYNRTNSKRKTQKVRAGDEFVRTASSIHRTQSDTHDYEHCGGS
mmetsp:Transcript_13098/g.40340  ORF Transcript_13098/g.40340 Transcript_13098/m.40340 type:complete len:283 (+) Transcript_13098:216-1064(+)